MPLSRATITAASRIMLPTYATLFLSLGVNYLVKPPRLGDSPALTFADQLLPLQVWGAIFLTAGLLMVTALATRRRLLFEYALWLGGLTLAAWAIVFAAAAFRAHVSATAWEWPAFGVAACYASYRSLSVGEWTR
jgi:hypothetical protein